MNEHFTERAREALERAHEEARALRHSYVGTEHLLLALLSEGEDGGTAASVLARFGVTHAQVRTAVIRMMGTGVEDPGAEWAFTGRAQDAIELAWREASERGAREAGTEDILLALTQEREGGAAVRILFELDADPADIRAALAS